MKSFNVKHYTDNRRTAVLKWEDLDWTDTSEKEGERTRLLAHISIGPYDMHLEAYEVKRDKEGMLRTVDFTEDLDKVFDGLTGEGEWSVTIIDGREYILLAQPYGA